MNGILLVCKPEGVTSAEVVRRVKRRARTKVGHLGTLDPFASGLLPLCLGEATKIAQFLNQSSKRYEGEISLGTATDTGDLTGKVIETAAVPEIGRRELTMIEGKFSGDYEQTPPMYSAIKHKGVPLYRLARQGLEIERATRRVRIEEIHLSTGGSGRIRFDVSCSKGTYVRVLAEDIGVALGTCAHLSSLRRTRFGSFVLTETPVDPDLWDPESGEGFLSIREALGHIATVRLQTASCEAVRCGQSRVLRDIGLPGDHHTAVLLDPAENVLAVVVREEGKWKFGRVFQPSPSLHGTTPMVSTADK